MPQYRYPVRFFVGLLVRAATLLENLCILFIFQASCKPGRPSC